MFDTEELVEWTAEAASHLSGPDSKIWRARIEARYPEIVAVLERNVARDPAIDAALRIATHLEAFWIVSNRLIRGRERLGRLLALSPQASTFRADALLCAGRLALVHSVPQAARTHVLEAGDTYRQVGNVPGIWTAFDLFCKLERWAGVPRSERKALSPLDLPALEAWTAEATSHLSGPDQAEWLARIDERLPVIVFAVQPGVTEGKDGLEARMRIAAGLAGYWWMRGRAGFGRSALEFLSPASCPSPLLWAESRLALADLAYAESNYTPARRYASQASTAYRDLASEAGVAAALNRLGMAERESGDLAGARLHHEEGLAIYRALGDERGAVSCRSNLGVVALFEGDLDSAEEIHEAALEERRRLGDARGVASSLGSLGTIARLREDYDRAQEMHEEALAMRRKLGDSWGAAGSLCNLGLVALRLGDLARASDLLGEATAGFAKVGDRLGVCEALDARALLTFAEDLPAEAVRLLAVAHTARKEIGAPLPPVYQKDADRVFEKCKARLDAKAFDAAWKAGLSPRYSPFA